jgi:hypothetical protein
MKKLMVDSFSMAALIVLMVVITVPVQAERYYEHQYVAAPEYLYYIEDTGSYYLPGQEADTFFNLGKWYRSDGGEWFASDTLDGPWSGILEASLPRDLADLPADFKASRKLGKIPYRYVAGPEEQDTDYYYRYYARDYYEEYGHRGYRGHRHSYRIDEVLIIPGLGIGIWHDGHRKHRY